VPGLWRSRAAGALAAHLAAPRPPALIRSALILIAVAAVLLLAGALLIYITRRRPRHAARSRSPT
jgi:hypothetical protein